MKPIRRQVGRTAIVIRRLRDAHNPARREQRNAMHRRFFEAARIVQPIHAAILPPERHLTTPAIENAYQLVWRQIRLRDRLAKSHRLFRNELPPILSTSEMGQVQRALRELRIQEAKLEQKRKSLWKAQTVVEKEFKRKKKKPIGVLNLEKKIRESLDFVSREENYNWGLQDFFRGILSDQEQ